MIGENGNLPKCIGLTPTGALRRFLLSDAGRLTVVDYDFDFTGTSRKEPGTESAGGGKDTPRFNFHIDQSDAALSREISRRVCDGEQIARGDKECTFLSDWIPLIIIPVTISRRKSHKNPRLMLRISI